ncbi:UvrD-helicase domain-containing protein [Thalassotalea agariperforans]
MSVIASSIFGRIFPKKLSVAVNKNGLTLADKQTTQLINWSELITPVSFEFGFFGQTICFATVSQTYKLTMMAYSAEYLLKTECDQYWVNAHLPKLNSLLNKITSTANKYFLRQSTANKIKVTIAEEHARWLPWIKTSKALSLVSKQIQWLEKYAKWDDTLTQTYQEKYIHQQLQQHKSFFDKVESNPLTERQRRACVIDNDNNLLLAGAGSGKTSVMIGRAGFLVASEQAKYEDILLLAYGRKAADEMDERIQNKLATDKIKATTFHSVGLNIISQVEGAKPSISVFSEDEKAKAKWVQTCFESFIENDPDYRALVLNYFNKYYYIEKNDFDFKTLGDYYQYLNDNDIRSLKGDKVKSFGELYIANWLFYHGIDYQYEAQYQFDVKTIEYQQYKPDFYLPEYNLYIEYYGIDEQGNTAPYIDKNAYHEGIAWKNATHEQYNTQCIALTYAQHKQGVLLSDLHTALLNTDIQCEMLPVESILASLKETGRITVLAELFSKLLGLYKAAYLDENAETNLIKQARDPKQITKALQLLKPIMAAYNKLLSKRGEIDFEDMIVKAIGYVKSGAFKSPWRYIMVDEFQDISEPRARLVKALRDNQHGSSVFAVGDDWQAIYRFSGADLKLTTQFAQYFGFTTQTELDLTFRFNNKIGEVASAFIGKNPHQLNKTMASITQVSAPAISLLRKAENASHQHLIPEISNGALEEALHAIHAKVCKPVTVYLLARFWFQLPNKSDLQALYAKFPLLKIASQSFHASKGKEADYVVILGLTKGKHGFPSEKATPPMLDALLPQQEDYNYAEERRLFYVALTRAKHRVYIIADMANASCFVHELINDHHIELNEFNCHSEQTYTDDITCMTCDTGILTKRTGRYGAFYACSHFPRCEHKEKPCVQCESPMSRTRHQGFKLCLNDACKSIIPTCKVCHAEMVLRASKHSEFWGCKNYRGNELMSCKNGVDKAKINWPELVEN